MLARTSASARTRSGWSTCGRAPTRSASRRGSTALLKRSSPEAEVLTGKEFIARSRRPGQPAARPDLRAARARGDRSRCSGSSTRSCCRSASAHASSGMLRAIGTTRKQVKQDRALRGGHHGDDRRDRSASCSGRCLAVLFTQPLDGFTLSIPVGSLILLLVLRRRRRRRRGDLPGAPRGAARRARGAGLRVSQLRAPARRACRARPSRRRRGSRTTV